MKKELLYHYTTGSALLGMLKDYDKENDNLNLTMWATHYKYMNDPTEFRGGVKWCKQAIIKIEKQLNIPLKKRIGSIINRKNFESYKNDNESPFVISFSRAKDSLHMWNMYAQNGNGIALRFDKKKLTNWVTNKIGHCNIYDIHDCIYSSKALSQEQIESIKEVYPFYLDINYDKIGLKKLGISLDQTNDVHAYATMTLIYILNAYPIKHEAYKEEKECRIIMYPTSEKKFRDKDGLIVPYIEQQIPFDCLDSIMVGPTADFERVRESILLFLESKGIKWEEDKIKKSKVPYRN